MIGKWVVDDVNDGHTESYTVLMSTHTIHITKTHNIQPKNKFEQQRPVFHGKVLFFVFFFFFYSFYTSLQFSLEYVLSVAR